MPLLSKIALAASLGANMWMFTSSKMKMVNSDEIKCQCNRDMTNIEDDVFEGLELSPEFEITARGRMLKPSANSFDGWNKPAGQLLDQNGYRYIEGQHYRGIPMMVPSEDGENEVVEVTKKTIWSLLDACMLF